jgi:uncharacterized protein
MFVKIIKLLIKTYQYLVSTYAKPRCRYYPSCSNYALQALSEHGARAGGWLAIKRLCRCNPLVSGGVDLVPQKLSIGENKS